MRTTVGNWRNHILPLILTVPEDENAVWTKIPPLIQKQGYFDCGCFSWSMDRSSLPDRRSQDSSPEWLLFKLQGINSTSKAAEFGLERSHLGNFKIRYWQLSVVHYVRKGPKFV